MTPLPLWLQMTVVAAGGIVGCLLRWAIGLWLNPRWDGFPLGTLAVNCVGGLLIGAALQWFERSPNETLRLMLVTGLLGGLTTFSSFTGESLVLLQRASPALAIAHTAAHLLGSLACAGMGFWTLRAILGTAR